MFDRAQFTNMSTNDLNSFSYKQNSNLKLSLKDSDYKKGFLRRSQIAKRGLLRVRYELGESGPVT